METNEIVKLILSDNKELSKSTRYYNLSLEEQVNVIISQRPELKNCFIGDVVGQRELLIAFDNHYFENEQWYTHVGEEGIDEYLSNL